MKKALVSPNKGHNIIFSRKEYTKIVKHMCLLDDEYAKVFFETNAGKKCLGKILSKILKHKVIVRSIKTQDSITSIGVRGVRLDIYVEDAEDRVYDVEIQKGAQGNIRKRGVCYLSQLVVRSLKQGQSFDELPECLVLFITEEKVIKDDFPVHLFTMMDIMTHESLGINVFIGYFYAGYNGDDKELSDLAHDINARIPEEIRDPDIRDNSISVKSPWDKGGSNMNPEALKAINEVVRNHASEYIAMGREDGIKLGEERTTRKDIISMAKKGVSLDILSSGFGIPHRKIRKILKNSGVKIPPRSL